MKRSVYFIFILLSMMALSTTASAQCKLKNTAFKSGEFLSYNLYYNWKMVYVKAGTASYSTIQTVRNGKQAYRANLTTSSNKRADEMFVLRDTVQSYSSLDLEPLYYRKGSREGSHYTVDEVFYSYAGGKTYLRHHRQHNNGTHTWQNKSSNDCVYDMLNILLRARSFNFSKWTAGREMIIPIATGKALISGKIKYRGKTSVKVDNGKKYNCLSLSYIEQKDGKYKETVRFYVTDDSNHIPVRIDFFLKFGTARALLTNMKGMKNEVTSIAK